MVEEVLGSGIAKGVTDQLLLRENLIGERNKSKEHLLFFNSNGAWVRLVSSVNVVTEDQAKKLSGDPNFSEYSSTSPTINPLEDIKGSNQLAEKNILFGGMYPDSSKPSGGISSNLGHQPLIVTTDPETQEVLTSAGSTKSRNYHNYNSLGFRPIPGIDSVTVASKNTYGTLREAEIKITVWTLEDLEVLQTLYLRPGYSMLLEWGHSLGLDKDGKIDPTTQVYKKFVQGSLSQVDIEKELLDSRLNANYNYDAMFGIVNNFSWSLRQDGGYDCTVKLISKGSVIESVRVAFDTSTVYPVKQMTPEKDETSKEERKSIFHKFRVELEKTADIDEVETTDVEGYEYPNRFDLTLGETGRDTYRTFVVTKNLFIDSGEDFKKNLNPFTAFPVQMKVETTDQEGDTDTTKKFRYYITLGTILDIYNNYCTLTNPLVQAQPGTNTDGLKYTKFYTGWEDKSVQSWIQNNVPTEYILAYPYQEQSKFLTSKYHFSINPQICLIPGQLEEVRNLKFSDSSCNPLEPYSSEPKYKLLRQTQNLTSLHNMGTVQINHLDLSVSSAFKKRRIRGDKDDILNILVALDHVVGIVDTALKEDKDSDQSTSNTMTVVIQRLLRGINDSLGGVNDLDMFYDEPKDTFYIVDRRLTPTEVSKTPEITLAGITSTVSNLSISSKISSNIGSQISIAAQGGNQGSKDNIGPLLQWNKGLIDRHRAVKTQQKNADKSEKTQDRLTKWLEDYTEVWRSFKVNPRRDSYLLSWAEGSEQVDTTQLTNMEALSAYHKIYCQKYVAEYYYKGENKLPAPGNIPVELSFTTIGISGLKIGQSFRSKRGVLPESYSDNFGFIITGLDHNIANNKWITNVKTLFYCLTPPPESEIATYRQELGLECTATTAAPPTGPLLPDPAIEINGTEKVGILDAKATPVYQTYRIDLRNSTKEEVLVLVLAGKLVEIGNANKNPVGFFGGLASAKALDGIFYLQSTAATQFLKWQQEVKSRGITFQITSAVRFGSNTGAGPHGYGIAVDINSLYQAANVGSKDPVANLNARRYTPDYKTIAEIGKKYDWYNPWRLSDQSGIDELWHFEYWGPA